MHKEWTAHEIIGMASGYQKSCTLLAAVQMDLFSALYEGPREESGLGKDLGCLPRPFDMLLTALDSMGLIQRKNGVVSLEDTARSLLCRQSPDYLGYIIRHFGHIMPGWFKLERAVYTGSRTVDDSPMRTSSPKEREDFLMGMFNVARLQADRIAGALDLTGRRKLLDLGGGPGTYAIYFCMKNPELGAVIFDLPSSEPFARKTIAAHNLSERISFKGGNYLTDTLPDGCDVAWLSQVLHGETPANAATLVKCAAESLVPGGLLCIQEFMLDDDKKGPERAALFGLNMLIATDGGQVYTAQEIRRLMEQAGAGNIRELAVELPSSCRILVGEMP